MTGLRRALLTVVALAGVTVASGCGSDSTTATDPGSSPTTGTTSSSTPTAPATITTTATTSPTTAPLPTCSSVWVAGHDLPRDYAGCTQGGTTVKPDKHPCAFGSGIVAYDNRFYAVTGRVINQVDDLAHSAQFHSAVRNCTA